MNYNLRFISFTYLLLILGFFSVVNAQSEFEGKLKFKIENNGENSTIEYFVKGENFRMEFTGEVESVMIYKKEKFIMIVPSQKMYMEFGNDVAMPGDDMDEQELSQMPTKTSETKNFFGHTANKWIFSDDETEVEIWAAEDIGNFAGFGGPMQEAPQWESMLEAEGFFPLMVVVKDNSGNIESKFEVIEMIEQKLDSKLFEVPEGFKKMSMPGME
ncbi:MAG: DUF4412 domain-containing protein [Melioribacteraceae bacterium]|nr:DUF4412 domain-containing protein [Melioribacteraceae bacterium]MCF8353290.1 DUF4412 domain-containing protein [Melioribacteraceae bacterium]MCF8394824.1 DUF4412 domain-containing protein [Melioribacteraceae bacterium]MCF8418817.1 DUF4412 domain-containing protein [Melioribacteraceae bacterium]